MNGFFNVIKFKFPESVNPFSVSVNGQLVFGGVLLLKITR